jgi:hypothetical protein
MKSPKRALLPLLLLGAAALFTACNKDKQPPGTDPASPEQAAGVPGKYKKEITLQDGDNTARIVVSGDNEARVNNVSAAQLHFKALTQQPAAISDQPVAGAAQQTAPAANPANALHITILQTQLAPGVKGYELQLAPADNERAFGGDWWYHNNDNSVNIVRYRSITATSNASFYAEGYYTNFWPFWSRIRIPGWVIGTYQNAVVNNLSLHVTAINAFVNVTFYKG